MPTCDVCQGERKITVATFPEVERLESGVGMVNTIDVGWKEFDCPQCSMVPYRRVRATKITTAYRADDIARMQVPIERGLAARFGEYLYREGLIRFTTSGTADFGQMEKKVTVTAHLNVVSRDDGRRAGATEEVAVTSAPPLPRAIRDRVKGLSERAKQWVPAQSDLDYAVTDEFDDPKDALANRFSGLEI